MEIKTLNPFGLQEGQRCDTICIQHYPNYPVDRTLQKVVVALPVAIAPTLQGAATEAYLQAKAAGQLTAGLMAVCSFSYRDDEQDAWIAFDPADY